LNIKKDKITIVIFSLIAILLILPVIAYYLESSKTGFFYAYGDSITRATGIDDLNPDGSDDYVVQMVKLFLPTLSVAQNMDGGGMTSSWGVENLSKHYNKNIKYFVYMFTNDGWFQLPDNTTIENYLLIYNYVKGNDTIPVPCIPILNRRPSEPEYSWESQDRRFKALESALDAKKIKYVKMYDALDSKPFNDRLDAINTTYLPDGIHPNKTGQTMMAQYLWKELVQQHFF
jgi:lysophospholipase L1-like esterase